MTLSFDGIIASYTEIRKLASMVSKLSSMEQARFDKIIKKVKVSA